MPIDHDHYDDAWLRELLTGIRSIAVVGASDNPRRPSFGVLQFLRRSGYTVFGVNPSLTSDAIEGVTTVHGLDALPASVDMVDVFRNSAAVGGVVDAVLAMEAMPRVIWMQRDVRDDAAARRAEERGISVVMNRCPAIEIPRLGIHS